MLVSTHFHSLLHKELLQRSSLVDYLVRSGEGREEGGVRGGGGGEEKGRCNGCMRVHVFRYGRDSIHVCVHTYGGYTYVQ